ncbi:MAG: hypothetical protein KF690_03315 [Bacteroidetes bacterium]|nr:hypothetical protein [Bacteroidota bacterium]
MHTPLHIALLLLLSMGGLCYEVRAQDSSPGRIVRESGVSASPDLDPVAGTDRVSGAAELILKGEPSPAAINEAKKEVRQLAMIDALEKTYGAVVYRSNSTTVTNESAGSRARTFSRFNMIANTYVKGDWVRTLNETYTEEEVYYDPKGRVSKKAKRKGRTEYIVRCSISGLARELKSPPVRFEAQPLYCATNSDCITHDFHTGDQLYLRFRSPADGWLSLWLDDQEYAYCLMPYLQMPRDQASGMRVEAGKEYLLFSPDARHYPFTQPGIPIDEMVLHTGSQQVISERIFVVFSPEPYNKPLLEASRQVTNRMDSALRGFQFPRKIVSEDFQEWLSLNQAMRESFQVMVLDISIVNSKR